MATLQPQFERDPPPAGLQPSEPGELGPDRSRDSGLKSPVAWPDEVAAASLDESRRIGLLAGWGDFPVVLARRLRELGYQVYCVGIAGHCGPELAADCEGFHLAGLGRFGSQSRFFRKHGVQQVTMAGKIFKTRLFERWALIKHFPDWACFRHFFPYFVSGRKSRNDDSLLQAVTTLYKRHGITMLPATNLVPELLVKDGLLTSKTISTQQWRDISYGWHLAKEMGRLDIGQSVAVKGRAVLAVEAIEGTDECIRRAGQLCPAGGFTVVKVAKPNQDMRFDVPTVGLGTIQTMRAVGARVLAIEADKTIVLNADEVTALANSHGISVIAISTASLQANAFAA